MAVSRIIEFKQNSQEARKKKKHMTWSATLLFLPLTAGTVTHVCPLPRCRLFLAVIAESAL